MAVAVENVESTLFVPIQKCEEMPDGSVMVYGLASGPDTDLDGQRMDPEWLKKAMPEWMVFGNIREMHQPKASMHWNQIMSWRSPPSPAGAGSGIALHWLASARESATRQPCFSSR